MTTAQMSRLPRNVRKQGEEAERQAQEFKKQKEAEARGEQPPATPPATPPPEEQQPAPQESQPPVEATIADLQARLEKEQERYRSLSGKYNAEVPRMAKQIAELTAKIAELTAKIDELAKAPKAPPPAAPDHTRPGARTLISDKDKALGEDIIGATERVARGEAQEAVAPLREGLSKLENDQRETLKRIREMQDNSFFTLLATLSPTWRDLNVDPNFHAWLDEKERFSTRTRQELLNEAFEQRNATSTAEFFTAYQEHQKAQIPAKPSDGLKGRVLPPTAPAGGKPPEPAQKRIFKLAEVEAHYKKVSSSTSYRNSPECKKLEAEIAQATREGRVK